MRRDPLSDTLATASFGRSVQWRVCSIGLLNWSVALSLPLGFLAVLLLTIIPKAIGIADRPSVPNWGQLAGIWMAGLAIQLVVTQALFLIPLPRRRWRDGTGELGEDPTSGRSVIVTVGGVWMAIPDLQLRPADARLIEAFGGASRVLALWSLMLLSIGMTCLGCLLIDTLQSAGMESRHALAASTVSIAVIDRPWVSASWIFCLQGFWQLLPIPQSLGRVGWSAVIGLFTRPVDAATSDRNVAVFAVRRVQWWLVGTALATLISGVLAIQLSGIGSEPGGRAWPALCGVILLALWLFVSARGEDLLASQLILAGNGETGVLHSRIGPRPAFHRWQATLRQRKRTRKLLEVVKRERAEASDAARADEILQRLHVHGRESLSEEERAILGRVSEAIRQERARDQRSQS